MVQNFLGPQTSLSFYFLILLKRHQELSHYDYGPLSLTHGGIIDELRDNSIKKS